MDKIYTVTTLYIQSPGRCLNVELPDRIARSRLVAWFPKPGRAREVVMGNEGDIYECGHYNYCVIEEVQPGLYPHVDREFWFQWRDKGYVQISKPKWLKNSINFGIG